MKLTKSKSLVLSAGAVVAVAYLGACGDDVTQVTKDGFESVASYKNLPECIEDNDGEMLLVKDSAAVYLCTDSTWKKMSGVEGAPGKEGVSCTVSALKDSSGYDVLCGGKKKGVLLNGAKGADGANGANGANGLSAYEIAKAGGYIGSESEWLKSLGGANGKSAYEIAKAGGYTGSESEWLESLKGANGQSCNAAVSERGIVVSCGGEVVGTLTNGADGEPCSGKTLEDGNIQVTCGAFTGVIRNGKSAYDLAVEKGYRGTLEEWLESLKGAVGPAGTSCTVQASSTTEGGYTLTCGESSVVIKDGKVGTSCTVQENETLGGYDLTCGGSTVHIKNGKNGTPGATGATGADGKSCTVEQNEDTTPQSYTLTCGNSSVVIKDGAAGANGANGVNGVNGNDGANGTSCTVGAKGDMTGVYTLTCGESSVDIRDGAAGTSCTVQENEGVTPRSYTLTCGGQSVTVSDGVNGINGVNGSNGADGSSCTVAEKNNSAGVYVLTCGESSVEIKDGAAGASCSVQENEGTSPKTYTLTCGTQSVVVSDGANGANGANGADGSGCTVQENNGTSPQSYTLTCGSSSIVIKDGVAGVNGVNGLNGADGNSCVVSENSTPGYYTLTCGNSSVVIKDGAAGSNGANGVNGKSAYELAVENGFQGTLDEWLATLVGPKGADGTNGTNGINGTNGTNGKSAYELAVEKGYTGTLDEWLASLVGANGTNGINGTNGTNGKSAYELAVEKGYTGTLDEWLASLVGAAGTNGTNGTNGQDGQNGADGTSCAYVDNGDGTVSIKCGDEDPGVMVYKAVCGTTPYDPAKQFCDTRDGTLYKMVTIGEGYHAQTWMAENLNYTTSDSYCYDDDTDNCAQYGRLYTWAAANDACPAGWHLPSKDEFKAFYRNVQVGWSENWPPEGVNGWGFGGLHHKLKALDWSGTDEYGFAALPAGSGGVSGSYSGKGTYTLIWSSTRDRTAIWRMLILQENAGLNHDIHDDDAYSVRCLKDYVPMCGNKSYNKDKQFCDTRDDQLYKKVTIGEGEHAQTWMAQNLNYNKVGGSWCGGGSGTEEGDCNVYGRLYTWEAANDDACPEGWHLPSKAEFEQLAENVGGAATAGTKLKAKTGWELWEDVLITGTDDYGFTALPAGAYRISSGVNAYVGVVLGIWSGSYEGNYAWRVSIDSDKENLPIYQDGNDFAFAVRCLQD